MKVRNKRGAIVIKSASLDGNLVSTKTIGYGKNKKAKMVCAIDMGTASAIVGAVAGVISTGIIVSEHYRASKKRCKFELTIRQRKCNQPIVHTEIIQRENKKFKLEICKLNHGIETPIHVRRSIVR